jgi:hypothetical protein
MLTITLAQLKADIIPKLKGTSIRQIGDFYSIVAGAANRLSARIDPEETRRTATMTTPFFDNVNDYSLATDYKRMIDIRPQVNRTTQPGLSHYSQTAPRQFNERLTPDSFSIRWNNMIRTLRAQVLPSGNVMQMDSFDVTIVGSTAVSNGAWSAEVDASGFYAEPLNYVEGNSSLGMNLSGATGAADILNTTAVAVDMSGLRYEDTSFLFFYIPVGYSSRFTNFKLRRGSSALNYKEATVTTKADGTAFSDGWNFLMFTWNSATTTGTPNDTLNTYRRFGITYTAGTAINGCLIDNWTDALGQLYEMEYYSEYMFRTSAGVWISRPTLDTDLVNVGPASYEILKAEIMIDITQSIRTGSTRSAELGDWRMMLNGQPPNKYIKDPQYRGLYADYVNKFPSSAIVTTTSTYTFDV